MPLRLLTYEAVDELYESRRTQIWRGHRLASGEPVVLKVLKPEAATDREHARFRHEFLLTARAELPGVIKTFSLESFDGSLLMVLEDIGGESLERLCARTPLSLPRFLELAIGLADTVARLHQRRIIHKDINPANIVLAPETGEYRLIDFGIADELPQHEVAPRPPAALEGTLAYISPEQTGRMNRAVDYRTDFYSLGATFYQLLTGRLPFEVDDALGLVHCHIAGTPRAPHLLDLRIPQTVSRIVMKLMSKRAEDRYQSGWGLKADLERCWRGLREEGGVPDFEPGLEDFADRLQPPQKLYGREEEVGRLLAAFERAGAGGRELLLVAGYAGVGKTTLVRETHRPILEKRGSYIEGKFDQLQRNVPYSGWIQAFEGFVNDRLMESESELARWRRDLLSAVGSSGKVLTDVIRNLELVIGAQPAVPELSGAEAQNRFNYLFLALVGAMATREHPLVVFLDDLQWIDEASLGLLRTLLTSSGISSVLVIGAYRDNEVNALHPLMRTVEALRKEEARFELLTLGNLSEQTVDELVADTLRDERSRTRPLARLIYSKTGGNAFFTLEMLTSLAERRAISFDVESRRWQWDISVLERMEITDNVVSLMLGKLQKLESNTRRVLTLAACMGFRFDVSNLSTIARRSEDDTRESLEPALREGLVVPAGSEFQFAHDRVQQAAYSLIPEADEKKTHLEIGRLLLRRPSERDHEEQLFTVVDHLNVGAGLLETDAMRLELAGLNLRAGRKAKASAAFAAAARYFEAGVALLGEETWATDYRLTLDLHSLAAEAATLVGDFRRTDLHFDAVVRHARNPADMVAAYMSRMMAFSAQGRLPEFMDCALDILDRLGVHVEPHPTAEDIQRALAEVRSAYDPKAIGALMNLPSATDPFAMAAMSVLDMATGSAYSGRPDLYVLFVCQQVKRTIEFGITPESMRSFACLGLLLCGLPGGDVDQGYQFGMLAMALAEKAPSSVSAPGAMGLTAGMGLHYKRHLRDSLELLAPLYPRLKERGDFELASYIGCWYCSNALLSGKELVELEREMAAYYRDMKHIRSEVGIRWFSAFWQAAQNLLGRSACPWVLDGEVYDRREMLRVIVETGNLSAQTALHVNTLVLCYLFERYDEALAASTLAEENKAGMVAMPIEPVWVFYDSLTRLALCSRASPSEKERHFERVAANQAYLELRAHHAPMNFRHKWHLVEAERARVLDDQRAAIEHYGRAVALARDNGFVQEEALADELAARFWAGAGQADYARLHLERAHRGYGRWQAWAKVSALEASHPELAARPAWPPGEPGALDLETVMKAAHAISREIELDRLLGTVMRIVIENAGAQSGVLLLEQDGEWMVAAKGDIGAQEVERPLPVGLDQSDRVSPAVVRFVARTRERVVLDDAANEGRFLGDPHIRRARTRSLLCAPLSSRGKLVGVLYLENNLATGAFTRDRVELLEMLLSPAATSLENARIYEALRESEAKYRRMVDTATEGIWALGPDDTTTFVNDMMAGMLGYSSEEMLGRPLSDFMFEEDVPNHLERMRNRRRGLSEKFERRLRRQDGQAVWLLTSATPIFDEAGHFLGSFAMLTDITERKRAEDELRAERRMFVGGPTVVFKWKAMESWPVEYVSPNVANQFGYVPEDLISGKVQYSAMVHPDDLARVVAEVSANSEQGASSFEQLYRVVRSDGVYRWINDFTTIVRGRDGSITHYLGYIVDITERKLAEEAQHRLNRELRALSSCNEVLLRAVDEQALLDDICRIVCDEAGYRMAWVGYAEDDDARTIRPVAWAGLESESDEHIRRSWADETEQGRGPAGSVIRSGRTLHIQNLTAVQQTAPWREDALRRSHRALVALPLKDESGKGFGALLIYSSTLQTITPDEIRLLEELAGDLAFGIGVLRARIERKRAERAVALMSFALNNVHEAAFLIDEHSRFQYVNEESCRILGYSRDELLGMGVADVDPDFPESRWPGHFERLQAERALTFEGRQKARDGHVFPVEINANHFEFDGQGYNMALVRDITERKQSERERERLLEDVQRERSLLGVVLDTAPVGITVYLAPDGRPRFFNKAAERILGRPVGPPELSIAERAGFHDLSLPSGEPFPAEELPLTRSLRGEMLAGVELLVRQPTGREVSILEYSAPIRDAEGRIEGAVLAFQDITPIREQERLREEFIAAAAHELKTPVTVIRVYAEALRRWAPEGREGREARAIEVLNAQTHRIDRRVKEMLEVVRSRNAPTVLMRSRFDLGELAEHMVERMQALTTSHRLSLRRQGAIPVEADRERIQEVLARLLDNALEVSPRGGDIEVRVWSQHGEALVSVRDQGVGIPKERQPHVFEPFYEALPSGAPGYRNVVSLSLYLSWLAISQHQGRIWLESEEGKGSTFSFSLPLAKSGEEELSAPAGEQQQS